MVVVKNIISAITQSEKQRLLWTIRQWMHPMILVYSLKSCSVHGCLVSHTLVMHEHMYSLLLMLLSLSDHGEQQPLPSYKVPGSAGPIAHHPDSLWTPVQQNPHSAQCWAKAGCGDSAMRHQQAARIFQKALESTELDCFVQEAVGL